MLSILSHMALARTKVRAGPDMRLVFVRTPPNEIRRLDEVKIGWKPIGTNSISSSFHLIEPSFETKAGKRRNDPEL